MSSRPRVLFYDIETTHNLVAAFRLLNDNYLPHENIIQERYIVSFAYKWQGDQDVQAVSVLDDPKRFKKDHTDDFYVTKKLHEIMSQADYSVAHNGDQYDSKYAEGRMIFHGMDPLPPHKKIDTLKIAREKFLFNSNRLDYLGRYLKLGTKVHTDNELWLKVLQGDKEAIEKMVFYNKHDVVLLEQVYNKLAPYMPNVPNLHLFGGDGCPYCGSTDYRKNGFVVKDTLRYRKYQCHQCRHYFTNRTSDKEFKARFKLV